MPFANSVGKFFGVASSGDSDTIEEWQNKVGKQLKRGEFGISLRKSLSRDRRANSSELLSKARRVLSLVETVQQQDDSSDEEDERVDKTAPVNKQNEAAPETSTQSSRTSEATRPGHILNQLYYTEDEDERVDGTTPANTRKVAPETSTQSSRTMEATRPGLTANQLYYTEDEIDFDSGSMINACQTDHHRHQPGLGTTNLQQVSWSRDGSASESDARNKSESDLRFKQRPASEISSERIDNRLETAKIDDGKVLVYKGKMMNDRIKRETSGERECISETRDEAKSPQSWSRTSEDQHTYSLGSLKSSENTTARSRSDASSQDPSEAVDRDKTRVNIQPTLQRHLRPEEFVYGKDALVHYKFYTQIEKKREKKELERKLNYKLAEYDWKIQAVDDLVSLAKDYYRNPESKNAREWQNLKRRVKRSSSHKLGGSHNRRKLDKIREHKPFFTIFITLAQLIAMGVLCILGKFTYIGVQPQLTLEDHVKTIYGMETVHRWTPPNIWIGPDQEFMISVGGVFAPCMRNDIHLQLLYSRQNMSKTTTLGCCEVRTRNTAGTTTEHECHTLTEGIGLWRSGVTCSNREAKDSSVRQVLRPCCLGVKGQCRLISYKHCLFLGGHFHQTGHEHCSQVNCLAEYCLPGQLAPSSEQPWRPASPNQWWRIPLSLFYHQGIVHVLLVAAAHWLLLVQMEKTAGWLRMICIYVLSGTAALMISAIMDPFQCHVGGVGAVFGMVGVTLTELVQFWNIIKSPRRELAKLLLAIAAFIFCGTLPYLNLFGMLGGLVIGALTGVVVLPYITFTNSVWQTRIRLILISFTVPLLLLIFFLLSHMLRVVQTTDSCEWCKLINCVPYTNKMCDRNLWEH